MGNCLVTKLNASVDNSNLRPLGSLLVHLGANENYTGDLFAGGGGTQLKLVSGSVTVVDLRTSETCPLPYDLGLTDAWKSITAGAEGAVLEVANKYGLTAGIAFFGRSEQDYPVYTDELYCTFVKISVEVKNGEYGGLYGDIASIKAVADLTSWDTYSMSNLEGDISYLAKYLSLSSINIYQNKIGGSIEELVAAYRAAGRTSGTISFSALIGTNVTYNGAKIAAASATLTWDANSLTFVINE